MEWPRWYMREDILLETHSGLSHFHRFCTFLIIKFKWEMKVVRGLYHCLQRRSQHFVEDNIPLMVHSYILVIFVTSIVAHLLFTWHERTLLIAQQIARILIFISFSRTHFFNSIDIHVNIFSLVRRNDCPISLIASFLNFWAETRQQDILVTIFLDWSLSVKMGRRKLDCN